MKKTTLIILAAVLVALLAGHALAEQDDAQAHREESGGRGGYAITFFWIALILVAAYQPLSTLPDVKMALFAMRACGVSLLREDIIESHDADAMYILTVLDDEEVGELMRPHTG